MGQTEIMDGPNVQRGMVEAGMVPKGWFNDPRTLRPISVDVTYELFGLEGFGP